LSKRLQPCPEEIGLNLMGANSFTKQVR